VSVAQQQETKMKKCEHKNEGTDNLEGRAFYTRARHLPVSLSVEYTFTNYLTNPKLVRDIFLIIFV